MKTIYEEMKHEALRGQASASAANKEIILTDWCEVALDPVLWYCVIRQRIIEDYYSGQ